MRVVNGVIGKGSGSRKKPYGAVIDNNVVLQNGAQNSSKKTRFPIDVKLLPSLNFKNDGRLSRSVLNSKIDLMYSFEQQKLVYELESSVINIANADHESFESFSSRLERKFFLKKYTLVVANFLQISILSRFRLASFCMVVINNSSKNRDPLIRFLNTLFFLGSRDISNWQQSLDTLCINNMV